MDITPEEMEERKCSRANNHCDTNDFTILVKFHLLENYIDGL